MFKNAVPLNRAQHQQLRFVPQASFAFAAREQAIPIVAHEAAAAAEEFVIVFAPEDGGLPLLLTGLAQDEKASENAYVDAEGRWLAGYVPAQVRRYPFALAERAPEPGEPDTQRNFTLCVVPDAPHFTAQEQGWALFADDGALSPGIEQARSQLADLQGNAERTQFLVQQLADAGLLSQRALPLVPEPGRVVGVHGFRVVDMARFQELPPQALEGLRDSDALALVQAHLLSLRNLGPGGVLAKAARPAGELALAPGEKLFDGQALAASLAAAPVQQQGRPVFEARALLAGAGIGGTPPVGTAR